MHRVLGPTRAYNDGELAPGRQSIAFFCNPNANTLVECLPGCVGTGAKYPAVRAQDYLVECLSRTYGWEPMVTSQKDSAVVDEAAGTKGVP